MHTVFGVKSIERQNSTVHSTVSNGIHKAPWLMEGRLALTVHLR